MDEPLFIIGAGFNLAANRPMTRPPAGSYPLGVHLARACFEMDGLPDGASVEDLFQHAIDTRNKDPLRKLHEVLMQADYEMVRRFVFGDQRDNIYVRFLERFPDSSFLSFNYDSLLELLLLSMNRWRPEDGYGVPVSASLPPVYTKRASQLPERSKNIVLHLHGSLCVYAIEHQFVERPGSNMQYIEPITPQYAFDPDMISTCFLPFEPFPMDLRYVHPDERIVAPIPMKAEGLKGAFVEAVYKQAGSLMSQAEHVVSIGYRFGEHDHASYMGLLTAIPPASRLTVIAPDARELTARLTNRVACQVDAIPLSFERWFAGLPS